MTIILFLFLFFFFVKKKCVHVFLFYCPTIFRQDGDVFREDATLQGNLDELLLQVGTDLLSAAWEHNISCFNPQQILNSTHTAELWTIQTYCKAYWGPQTLRPLSWWCGPQHSHRTGRQQCACHCHCSKLMKAEKHRLGYLVWVLCSCLFLCVLCSLRLWKVKRPGVSVLLARWVILQQVPSALTTEQQVS